MNEQYVVVVDQSTKPANLDGFTSYGPVTGEMADRIVEIIHEMSMDGLFNINAVIAVPLYGYPAETRFIRQLFRNSVPNVGLPIKESQDG